MILDFHRLPTVLLLGALVPIFWFLYRSDRSYRVRLWLIAWTIILLRAIVQVFGARLGLPETSVSVIDYGGLQLAGVVLLVSMTRIARDHRQRWLFFLILGIPSVVYAELLAFDYSGMWAFAIAGIALSVGGIAYVIAYHRHRLEPYMVALCAVVLAIAAWGFARTIHGHPDIGLYTIETATFAIAGFLYWYSFRRISPGVALTVTGFFAWAAVFPGYYLLSASHSRMLDSLVPLANLPKFWVAIGMIVTLLEEKSRLAELAETQERATREQIQRFFYLTSRLLGGVDVAALCDEVASAITQASTFSRAVVLLVDENGSFYVAGDSEIGEQALHSLREQLPKLTTPQVEEVLRGASQIGPNSLLVTHKHLHGICRLPSQMDYSRSKSWSAGDKVVVPLRTPSGHLMGCFSLDEPRDVERVNAAELPVIEMLSADLAIAMENSRLQRQLVMSEKLAGMGRLVAGAGHELNNPLTAVLGYAEMLASSAQDEATRRSTEIIRREALRMRQIIESLLRFARQTKFERRSTQLPAILDEVLKLRTYEMRRTGIQMNLQIEPDLPPVIADEGLIKQVFLNIVNNSIDALRHVAAGKISVEVTQRDDRVEIRFTDNGSGFSNPDRVFDPFFTTKDPGEGPGLGLSVSYGIIKQHGGDINAFNLHPSGACVVIELPTAADSDSVLPSPEVAKA